jgi:hypothetical protein
MTLVAVMLLATTSAAQTERARWVALAKNGFALPEGRKAADLLVEMNALLASPDPVLRDDVAYTAAERWIRAGALDAADLRKLMVLWLENTKDGRGAAADDRVFKRSFSALTLSLIAARDLTNPFLDAAEVQTFFESMLTHFGEEIDLRGFDPARGWIHSVAHTADALKFLARNPKLPPGADIRLLQAVRAKIESTPTVFVWGENDRMALALQSAIRRPDADPNALAGWLEHWANQHQTLWANGAQVDPARFARVENARQVMRSLHTALALEAKPTPIGDNARQAVLVTLGKMR